MSNDRKDTPSEPVRRPNPRSADRGYTRATTGRTRRSFSFKNIEAAEIGEFVQHATSQGLAVILGVTSDAGALSVTVLDGDERIREWPSSIEDWNDLHTWLRTRYGID